MFWVARPPAPHQGRGFMCATVPYPFVRASQVPCCIVIKPTRGDFLHDYRNNSNLHIGVTDSEGRVYEYDFEGLHSDGAASWMQCLAVPIISSNTNDTPDPVWKEYWDFTLHSICNEEDWSGSNV
ncbi:MKRN2 opposite strand protein, partial [Armadillidium vulgare]